MTRQTLLILCCCLSLWLPGLLQTTGAATQAQTSAGVADIEAYVRQMDARVKRERRRGRLFADTSDPTQENAAPRWQEFKSERALRRAQSYSAATLWSNQKGQPVVAEFSLSSPSGDWAQFNTYYYRDDSTLAKLHSELRTFMGDVIVIRDRLYDAQGKMLQEKTRYLDLQTRRPKKVEPGGFMDMPIELYLKTNSLPFSSLLKKQR